MGDEMKRHFDKLERQLKNWETTRKDRWQWERPEEFIKLATLIATELLQVRIKRYSHTIGGNGVRITNKTIRQHRFRTRSGKE